MVSSHAITEGGNSLAIEGQSIYFYYDRKKKSPILNNVNISVSRSAIYSLLGPSGCGKTTLLKCIIGLHKPQEGSLKVYGRVPGSKGFFIPGRGVGYMPQDLALYIEMSIEEILIYFGSLYGMTMRTIKERVAFLIELLELPDGKRTIKHLSGGQQRRVSFAIALISKPPLLILDEPTVGVDPLLRQTIWNHLVTLAKTEHMTIIITTHYTEEARQADVVGLMRMGQLLVERNPENLLKEYRVVTLEEVFLRLCQRNNDENEDHKRHSGALNSVESISQCYLAQNGTACHKKGADESHADGKPLIRNREDFLLKEVQVVNKCDGMFEEKNSSQDTTCALLSSSSFPKEFGFVSNNATCLESLKRFSCLTRKNFLRLTRNILMLSFSICLPTIQIVIFCLCFANNPFDLQVAVANMEENVNDFGGIFLSHLSNHTIYQKHYDNEILAYESVKRGESWAAVHIGPEFSTCLADRILEGADTSNDTIKCSSLKLYVDVSNQIIFGTIYKSLVDSYQIFASSVLANFGKNPSFAALPMDIENYVYGSSTVTVMEFMAPGIIICIAYIIPIALTLMTILEEKKIGIFDRTFVAGTTSTEVLLAFFSSLLLVVLLQVLLLLTCSFYFFNIPCQGSFFWVGACVLLVGISGMNYGFLISSCTEEISSGIIIAIGSFFPTIFLGGVLWPVQAMPYYLRYFSYCLPLTLIIDSLRSIVARGWNIVDYHIWDGFLLCSGWAVFYMVMSIVMFKLRK